MAAKIESIATVAHRTGLSKSDVGKVHDETFAEIRRAAEGERRWRSGDLVRFG